MTRRVDVKMEMHTSVDKAQSSWELAATSTVLEFWTWLWRLTLKLIRIPVIYQRQWSPKYTHSAEDRWLFSAFQSSYQEHVGYRIGTVPPIYRIGFTCRESTCSRQRQCFQAAPFDSVLFVFLSQADSSIKNPQDFGNHRSFPNSWSTFAKVSMDAVVIYKEMNCYSDREDLVKWKFTCAHAARV